VQLRSLFKHWRPTPTREASRQPGWPVAALSNEQTSDLEAAMNAYLSWEVDLLERIKQDGTTRFVHAPRLNSHSH
jgi:hypothetical protein